MKQETLKEATNKYANKNGDIPTTELEDAIFKQGFIDGAKWQQEQDKNRYSEEEVINAFNEGQALNVRGKLIQGKEWFEKFKNK
jgi:hypothetical protein